MTSLAELVGALQSRTDDDLEVVGRVVRLMEQGRLKRPLGRGQLLPAPPWGAMLGWSACPPADARH
jgi:hypothetical protein